MYLFKEIKYCKILQKMKSFIQKAVKVFTVTGLDLLEDLLILRGCKEHQRMGAHKHKLIKILRKQTLIEKSQVNRRKVRKYL
jgi:hypothetical protein